MIIASVVIEWYICWSVKRESESKNESPNLKCDSDENWNSWIRKKWIFRTAFLSLRLDLIWNIPWMFF